MKPLFILGLLTAALTIHAAEPKADVKAAIEKLSKAGAYSWTQTTENAGGGGGNFRAGPTSGKVDKDGVLLITTTMGDNTSELVKKGEKFALKTQDGWQSEADLENAEGRGRFAGFMARAAEAPTAQAQRLVDGAKTLSKEGDAYTGELNEETVKQLLSFRRGRGGNNAPEVSVTGGKGTVKFWTKDGALSKYEYTVKGTVSFNNNDREVDRTTKVEIKDVGTTSVTVPEEAKKKLS